MPGTIIRALRDAGSRNPVFMIDEIDKMGADFRGDPASAMLEVLDPSQNDSFRDHYLDLDFDLSEVIFIATANMLDPIPAPLRDRMEVIQLSGYTVDEKLHIARRYLVPRQVRENGLKPTQAAFSDAALRAIIEEYTREAGVRNLERQIGTVCRKLARERGRGRARGTVVDLGQAGPRAARPPPLLLGGAAPDQAVPASPPGLAWTPVGGEVLFIEATAMPGTGKLTITGQLGDVMRESAQAALSLLRGDAGLVPARPNSTRTSGSPSHDIHLHVPAGAVPKDGPSAGVAMLTALTSLLSGAPGSQRRRDDRRDHADRPGAAGRRPEGEVAGRPAGRDQAGDRARPQRGRDPRDPRAELGGLEFVYVERGDGSARRRPRALVGPVAPSRPGSLAVWGLC